MSNVAGKRVTKTILGNREHKKTYKFVVVFCVCLCFLREGGNRVTSQLYQGNKGTGTPCECSLYKRQFQLSESSVSASSETLERNGMLYTWVTEDL